MEFVNGLDFPREIGELFHEYTDMLVEGDPKFQVYLDMQDYDEELQHLEGKYGPPGGRLILATEDGKAVGCIALKRRDEPGCCELKRLYVRPAFRGRGLGRELTDRIIAAATVRVAVDCQILQFNREDRRIAVFRMDQIIGYREVARL